MASHRNDEDGVFAARVGLGLRELDGTERAPDVSREVVQRLERGDPARAEPAVPRLALLAALCAAAATVALLVWYRGTRASDEGVGGVPAPASANQDPKGQERVGPWRLEYGLHPDDVARWSAEHRKQDVDALVVGTVGEVQRRLGARAVVTRGKATTLRVTFPDATAADLAAARELLENPGRFEMRAVAEGDYTAGDVRFDLAGERKRLQAWLDEGGRAKLQRDVRAIADYRPASEHLRWLVHVVRPDARDAVLWSLRLAGIEGCSAATVVAHDEADWNGGLVSAAMKERPPEERFLVELIAVNLHERHFHAGDLDPASIAVSTTPDSGPSVDYGLRNEKATGFAEFTEKYVGKAMAVIWNDEVVLAPRLLSRIAGRGRIAGLSAAQAETIGRILSTPIGVRLQFLRSERDPRR